MYSRHFDLPFWLKDLTRRFHLEVLSWRFDQEVSLGSFELGIWLGDLARRFDLKFLHHVLTLRFFHVKFFHLKFFDLKVWVGWTWRFGLEFWIEVLTLSFDLVFSLGVLTWRVNLKFRLEGLSFGPLNAIFELIYWQVNLHIDNFDIFPNFDLENVFENTWL